MTDNLDRFAQGLPDPQDVAALEECQACGGEIHPGERVWIVDDRAYHSSIDCLPIFFQEMTVEEWLGVE